MNQPEPLLTVLLLLVSLTAGCAIRNRPACVELLGRRPVMKFPYMAGYLPGDTNVTIDSIGPGKYKVLARETNDAFRAYLIAVRGNRQGYVISDSLIRECQDTVH
jgi:hypothetical protein